MDRRDRIAIQKIINEIDTGFEIIGDTPLKFQLEEMLKKEQTKTTCEAKDKPAEDNKAEDIKEKNSI